MDNLTRQIANFTSMKIKAIKNDGSLIELWPRDPLGHSNYPMGENDVRNKCLQTVEPVYGKEKTAQVLERRSKAREISEFKLAQEITSLDV